MPTRAAGRLLRDAKGVAGTILSRQVLLLSGLQVVLLAVSALAPLAGGPPGRVRVSAACRWQFVHEMC
jgi:hypothetical protein